MNRTFAVIVAALLGINACPLSAQVLTTLHSFTNADGAEPYAGVTASGNTLFGTTKFGGNAGSGVIFKANTDGTGFSVVHSFTYSDGGDITADLFLASNTLYGASYQGGSGIQQGDLYSLSVTGSSFTNIYNFTGTADGDDPKAGLVLSGNTLYGTGFSGTGASFDGTVFSVATNGSNFTTLHTFTGADGNGPLGDLVLGGNVLYGTTYNGGLSNRGGIFSIQTNGSNFMLLHSFSNTDGTFPSAGLVLSGGTLYGTASAGGQYGVGTVFSINTNGSSFTVLYSFVHIASPPSTDGQTPLAALFLSSNVLYGTASAGGTSGNGTVFSISTAGTNYTQLYSFGPSDGQGPAAPVILLGNSLYGTTVVGGNDGNGSLFGLQIKGIIFTFEPSGATNVTVNGGAGFGAGGESLSYPNATIQYQWRLNGVNIPGQTSEGLSYSGVQPTNGGTMTMTISDGAEAATSVPVGFSVAVTTQASGNDNFASRFSLGTAASGVVASSNTTASRETGEPQIIAGNPGGKSIWFKWVPAASGTATFTAQGSQFDTMMGVYTGTSVSALTRVPSAVNDDDAGGYLTSRVPFACVAGTEYEIVVDGYWGTSGNIVLSWTNQTVTTPLASLLQVPPIQTISSNGGAVTLVCQPSSGIPSWLFNGQATGVTGTNYVIGAVNDATVGTYVAQVTTAGGVASTEPVHVQVNTLEDGTSDPNSVAWNKFLDSASASYSNPPQPSNRKLGGGGDTRGFSVAQTFSTVGATGEPGEPSVAGQIGGSPVWYTYVTPTNGAMLIDTTGSSFNTLLGVYVGPGNSFATLTNIGAGFTTNRVLNGQPEVYIPTAPKGQTNFIVVDGYGGTSGTVHLNINLGDTVVISTPPQNQYVIAGSNATFSVAADGSTPLSYVWQFNGTNIAGATNSSLTVPDVQAPNTGLYTVVVSNRVSLSNISATLSLGTLPVISTHPLSQIVAAGSTVKLNVAASGTPPPDYQWMVNGGATGTDSSSLSIPNFQAANQGTYFVFVTNAVGEAVSSNALLLLNGAPVTVTANSRSKIYGQPVTFAGTEFTASGLESSNSVNSVTLTSSGAAAAAVVAGSPYPIVPSAAVGNGLNNYTITYANGALTVSAAPLTVTAASRTKNYGQALTFAGTEFTTTGLQNSDTVTTATLTSPGATATATVAGSPYNIAPSAAVGTGLNNYTVAYANATLTVKPAVLTITANNRTKIYGQTATFAGTEFTVSGLVNGDSVSSVTLASSGAAATATVGGSPYPIVASAATGVGLANYTINYVNGSLTVNDATPIITWAAPSPITYGTALNSNQLNAAAGVPGSFAYTPTNGTLLNTGTNTLSVIVTPTDTADYINVTNTVSLVVLPAALTVTASNLTKTYGQTATFAGTEFTTSGLVNGDTLTSVTLASFGAAATATVGGSPYPIVPSAAIGADLTNYTITYSGGALAVNPAALTVTANNQTKTYGQTLTFAGTEFSASGLVNGDTVTSVALVSSGSAATAAVAGSPYGIASSGAAGTGLNNYAITYANGNLSVNPAPLTVTASPQSKIYGQTVSIGGGSTQFVPAGLQNGESVGSVTLVVNNNGAAATAPVSGSPYTITPSAATGGTFSAGNYSITYATANLTVSQASLTITANPQNKTYGQTVSFGSGSTQFTPGGLQNGESVGSVTLAVNNNGGVGTATVSGSPYTITPSAATGGTFLAGNYAITYATGSLTVSTAALTVTALAQTKVYGQTMVFGGGGTQFTSSTLQNGETIGSVTLAVTGNGGAATAAVSGSPYTITASAATGGTFSAGNYAIAYIAANLTVNPAPLIITASPQGKTYGQTVLFGAGSTLFSSSGLQNAETIGSVTLSVSGNGGAAMAPVSGSPYIITPSAATGGTFTPGNYAITYAPGTLTVSGQGLTITWADPASITYGAALTATQLNATASVAGTFTYTPTNGSVLNSGVNTLSVLFTPNDTVDYSNTTYSVNLVVSKAPLTVTAANASRTYGVANPVLTGEITGVTNGDNITATYSTTATSASPLNTYSIGPSLVDPNNRQTNYIVGLVNGTLTVGQATPTLIWTNPASIAYGAALTSSQLNAGASVPGGFLFTPGNGSVLNAGTNSLSVIFTPSDNVDYKTLTDSVTLVVSPASLTVTASNFSRPFDTANPDFTGMITGITNGDNITATYSCSATNNSPVGTYSIMPTLVDPNSRLTNYNVTSVSGILLVGHPMQSFSWITPASVTYGTALSSAQLNATANVPGTYSYAPASGTVLNTGTNTLSVIFTPTDPVDYTGVTDAVSLVVLPATLFVTADSFSRQLGAANPAFTGTIMGLTNGDDISASYSCSATTGSPAGSYAIVPSLVDPENSETNYVVTLIDGTLTVAAVVAGAVPQITLQPANQSALSGGAASFSVTAAGNAPLVYQWQFVGTNLAFATNTLLVFNPVATTNAGSYDVVITNSFGSVTSATVTLSVLGVPVSFVTTSRGIQFTNGLLQLSLSGLTGQGSILIEASSDLTHWTPVFTNPPGFGTIQFIDPATTNFGSRYYRVTTPGP